MMTGPAGSPSRPKRRSPLKFVCDIVVSAYSTIVTAVVAIIDDSRRVQAARGRLEDTSLTRSKRNPRKPKPDRSRGVSTTLYTSAMVAWFGFTSDANVFADPVGAFRTAPGNAWVVLVYAGLVAFTYRRTK